MVIDTITRALGGADQMSQAEMTLMFGGLQDLTRRTGVSILIVDHHRKQSVSADHLDSPKSSVNRELAVLLRLGKIVQGEHVGHSVPYLVAEDGETDAL